MKHTKSGRMALAATVALVGLLGAATANATWYKGETEHFTVYSDTDEKTTRDYAIKLEDFKYLTDNLLEDGEDDANTDYEAPFTVYILKNSEDLKIVRPNLDESVAGVYFTCPDGVSAYGGIYKSDPNTERAGQDASQLVLFHEYSHHLMFHDSRALYPSWYVEGFADYLATVEFDKDKIAIGKINGWRSETLDRDQAWTDYADILNPEKKLGSDSGEIDVFDFYAQAWILTHYMLSDPTRGKALQSYFARIDNGEDPVTTWESATGIKVKDLSGILHKYAAHMPFVEIDDKTMPAVKVDVTRLDSMESNYLLLGSALNTCPDPTYGKTILGKLTAMSPQLGQSPDFGMALAKAQILFGDPKLAEPFLTQQAAGHPDDFDALYLLGRLNLQLSDSLSGKDTAPNADANHYRDAARGWFGKAYALDDLDAPNLYFLARSFSDTPGFPNGSAMNAADSAHEGERSVYEYAEYDAWLKLLVNDRPDAEYILGPFASDPHNHARAAVIKQAIAAIRGGSSPADVMTLLHSGPATKDDKNKPGGKS